LDPPLTEGISRDRPAVIEDTGLLARLSARSDFASRYELQERMGKGGQGEILKAWDLRLRRPVAIKRMGTSGSPESSVVARFLAEAQIAGQLQHPGILPVHDVGLDLDGRPFYTTDLLSGTTLADVLMNVRGAAIHEPAVTQVLEQMARIGEIVAHAHSRGVIHRDLKPENILVGDFGDVRVIDWGSAYVTSVDRHGLDLDPTIGRTSQEGDRPGSTEEGPMAIPEPPVLTGGGGRASPTDPMPLRIRTDRSDRIQRDPESSLATSQSGQPITVLYTPPESLDGSRRIPGPSTDVYAVGVMLYELCAGRRPYTDQDGRLPTPEELKRRILAGDPVPVGKMRRRIPRDLAAICGKAMARDPARRYSEISGLSEDIRAFLQVRPVKARPSGVVGNAQKWLRRHSLVVSVGAVGVTLLSLTTSVAFRVDAERRRVDAERRQALGDELAARQVKVLRESDLAAREGRWKDVIGLVEEAEKIGYADAFELALRRLDAWIVLWQPDRARTELNQLALKGGQDPKRRALVSLRMGEFELFDSATAEQGVAHVKEALELGLNRTEATFARGVLASTTTEALGLFRATLALDPNHHGAHRFSLGLEMLSGQHEALASHIQVFRALFPDDPTPMMAEAVSLAFRGDLAGAQSVLAKHREVFGESTTQLITTVLELFSSALPEFDVEYVLGERKAPAPMDLGPFMKRFGALLLVGSLDVAQMIRRFGGEFVMAPFLPSAPADPRFRRLPQLPCMKAGVLEGTEALFSIAFPLGEDTVDPLKRIRPHWDVHREALVPYGAAYILENRATQVQSRKPEFLARQAALYDLAAESFSVFPSLPRLARYRAALAHFQLAIGGDDSHRVPCLGHVRRGVALPQLSASELREYFAMAFRLGDHALAAELLPRWERARPDDPLLRRSRVQLQMATGALGPALEALDKLLLESPDDAWALKQREMAREQVRRLAESLTAPSK